MVNQQLIYPKSLVVVVIGSNNIIKLGKKIIHFLMKGDKRQKHLS